MYSAQRPTIECDEKMVLILFLCWDFSRPIRMGLNSARIFKVSFRQRIGTIIHHKTGKWKVTHKNSGGFCDQIVVTFTRNIGFSSNYLFPMWESHETYQNEFINIQKCTRITFKYDNLTNQSFFYFLCSVHTGSYIWYLA